MFGEQPLWEIHPRVAHYTNQTGLFGILESGRLWASHFGSLNDLTEFQTIIPILQSEFFALAEQLWHAGTIKLPAASKEEAEQRIRAAADALPNIFWNSILFDPKFGQAFVASFCGQSQNEFVRANGLLSQWRGYGDGGGYLMEFDTRTLHEMAGAFANRYSLRLYGLFADVIYDERSRNYDVYRRMLERFLQIVPIVGFTNWLAEAEDGIKLEAIKLFIQIAARLKHEAFFEEDEVRIVVMRIVKEAEGPLPPIKFRSRRDSIIPYVELFDGADIRSSIRRIVVGPHHRSGERAEAVRLYLSAHDLEAEVHVSETPFRGE